MQDAVASLSDRTRRTSVWRAAATASVFLFVLATSVALGGAVYSSRVVEALWSADPPQSMAEWAPTIARAGIHFWSWVTPGTGLLALLTLATSFYLPPRERRWRILAAVLFLGVLVSSVTYFAPTVAALNAAASNGAESADVVAGAQEWVRLNTWRMLGVFFAWLSAVRALTLVPR